MVNARAVILAGLILCPDILHAQELRLDAASAQAVVDLLAEFDATGSGRGGAAVADRRSALFSANAVFVNAFGIRIEGRDSLAAFWRRLYSSGSFGTSTIERLDRQQRVLGPDLVLIDHVERITGQRDPATGQELSPRTAHLTLLLRREIGTGWRIVYYRAGDVRT